MPNYLLHAGGTLGSVFSWSFRWYAISSSTEATVQSTWHAGVVAMFASSAFNALLPSSVELTETYTSTMNSAWKQTTKTLTTESTAGTATTSLPWHVCEVVTWRTAQATKYGRGRWYLPCLGTGALATGGGKLSATAVSDIVTAVNALLSTVTSTIQPVILHRKGTKSGPGALTTDNIVGGDVPDGFDTQRRRGDKYVPARSSLTY